MKKKVELPVYPPMFSTFNCQSITTVCIANNPSIRNWYLNQAVIPYCWQRFLTDYTTPHFNVVGTNFNDNTPFLIKKEYPMEHLGGYVHYLIRNLLDAGYYAYYTGVDDYYVEGKSWYHERHFNHDGTICGYDRERDLYLIHAYDQNWVCRAFWTPRVSFERGRQAIQKENKAGTVWGVKASDEPIAFSAQIALGKIKEYLNASLDKYPENGTGGVIGIAVQYYLAKYPGRLYDGSIPYERMDRRIFRLVWEHKKVMLERIRAIEKQLSLSSEISDRYAPLVETADFLRLLYASHRMKRRDSVLPIIQQKQREMTEEEEQLLWLLVKNCEGRV